jgi:hypothetical protein
MYRIYHVQRSAKAPLVDFMVASLSECGCTPIRVSPAEEAPFRITFETATGERMGIVAYAFFANSVPTRNRPEDEHRFQIKYGPNSGELHEIWQDPFGLYTTVLLGINTEQGFFVGADPVLNSPTRFFISKEFKDEHATRIIKRGWFSWTREQRSVRHPEPVEVLVGATPMNFLRYILFEREARGEEQGHRQLLAEQFAAAKFEPAKGTAQPGLPVLAKSRIHALEHEFDLRQDEILDLIERAPRLKMAVRGWVAEQHLVRQLRELPDVLRCEPIEEDGRPDVEFQFRFGRPMLIECKNVLRKMRNGLPRLDFMKSRESKTDPCRRYYSPREFDVVAACLHPLEERWTYKAHPTSTMRAHPKCIGKMDKNVLLDESWTSDVYSVLREVAAS